MQNEKDENGSKLHGRSPVVSYEQGNDSIQADSAATCINDDRTRGGFADRVKMSRGARISGGSTTAARLRRSSRLPRPTASMPNGVIGGRRDDDIPGGRRTRCLPTLQGVVINSPTYSATRPTAPLVANIISKCRIPAPVTTRRISSWTSGCGSQTAASTLCTRVGRTTDHAVSEYNSRARSVSPNFGDPSTSGIGESTCSAVRNDTYDSSTIPELKYNVRFIENVRELHREHVCCGCAGSGLVSSHLLCIRPSRTSAGWEKEVERKSTRRTSPRTPRVYRFDASAGHKVAVAQVAVEAGLELLPSQLRCSKAASDDKVPRTISGSVVGHEHNSNDQAAAGQGDEDGKMAKHELAIDNELPDSQLRKVVVLDKCSSAETGSKQTSQLSSKRYHQQTTTISRIPQLVLDRNKCISPEARRIGHFLENSDAKRTTISPQRACNNQLASASYTVTDERRTTLTKATEKSIASKLRKVTNNCSIGCQLSPVKRARISEARPAVIKAAKMSVVDKSLTSSHMRYEPTRRKWSGRVLRDRQDGKRKRYVPPEASKTISEPIKFVTLSGHSVPIDFEFAGRGGTQRRSIMNVTFADKDDGYQCQQFAGDHELATRPPWRDLLVDMPSPKPQEYRVHSTEIVNNYSPKLLFGQVKNSLESEIPSADQSAERVVIVKEQPAAVAKAHFIEPSERLYTSEDLVMREQTTLSCDSTMVSCCEQGQQQPHSVSCVQAATPSFFIGIAPPPSSLDVYHRKRPVSRNGDSHSVEPTPSFISCSASEKDFSQTPARQNKTADKPPMRRKTSTVKDAPSTTAHRENRLSWTSNRRSKSNISPSRDRSSLMSGQNSKRNKTSSNIKASTVISQRKLESPRASTAKHAESSTPAGRRKRFSVTTNDTDGSGTNYLIGGKNLHREKELVESRKRTGNVPVNMASHKRLIDLCSTPKYGQSKCINSEQNSTESGRKISRMKYMSRHLNQTSELCGISQFAVENALDFASEQEKKVSGMFFVPLDYSPCRLDEVSNEKPSQHVKKPVSFFISCSSDSRSGSRTATRTSRIPRPQINGSSFPVKSYSYVVSAARTLTSPCYTDISSTQRHPAPPELCSRNESLSPTSTDLRLLVDNNKPPNDASLNALSIDTISDLKTQAPAVVITSNEEYFRAKSQPAVLTAAVPQEPSGLIPQPLQLALSSCSSISFVEPNIERLQINLHNERLQCSSNISQLMNALSIGKLSNLTTQNPAVATESNKEHSLCTVLAPTHPQQERSEQSPQSLQLALSHHPTILSVEPNLENLSSEACNDQCSSISPIEYNDAADCKMTEQLLFFSKSDREFPVSAEVGDALEISTTRPGRLTEISEKASSNKSEKQVGKGSLNAGLQFRLRNFDEVSIELPDIVWSKLQSGEIHYPEMARLCRSAFEALVLRNAVLQPSQPPSDHPFEQKTASRKTKLPLRLLVRAQTRRHFVESSAELSINVVCSRIDQAVQSVNTAFQLNPPNLVSWITKEDNKTTRTEVESNTESNYISAKRYLEQLETDLKSTNQLKKCNTSTSLPSAFKRNKKRQPGNLYQLEDSRNTEESKRTDRIEQEYKEQDRYYEAEVRASYPAVSFDCTVMPEVKSKKNQIDVKYDSQPRLRSPRSDLRSCVVQKEEAKEETSDDDQLPVDPTRKKIGGDDVISDEVLPVLAAKDKRRAAGEPCWQPSKDNGLSVDQSPRLSSGE